MLKKKNLWLIVTVSLLLSYFVFSPAKPDGQQTISTLTSPNHEWIATLKVETWGLSFGPIMTVVYLRKTNWFGQFNEAKVAEFDETKLVVKKGQISENITHISWSEDNKLIVHIKPTIDGEPVNPPLKLGSFNGVEIVYLE